MLERSREMMHHLKKLGVGKNPIIWVGHSTGGLFVKQMIVDGKYHL
jgi:pimeloyl-ACP methyl ester carboxylesterase